MKFNNSTIAEYICDVLKKTSAQVKATLFLEEDYGREPFIKEFKNKGISFVEVDREGGEDQGRYACVVYEVTEGENKVYFTIEGSHSSYEGYEYCNFYQCSPVEVKVIKYARL